MENLIFTVALMLMGAGIFIWLCVRLVPPNTLAIPVFLGGRRLNRILEEGLNIIFPPFCSLIYYLLKPRERMSFDFSVNVLDDQIQCKGTFGFQLLPPHEMKKRGLLRTGNESNYLLLYDKQQEKIETDAKARLSEMLDEQLTAIPAECALSKKLNDAIQLVIGKGLKYQIPGDKSNNTAEQKIIALVTAYKEEFERKMTARKVAVADIPVIPLPEERDMPEQDNNMRGLERIFLEDYGVLLTISTLALEPNPETAKVRSEFRQRDIEREIERLDTELVLSMIKKVKEDNPSLKEQEARDLVMVVQEYYQRPEAQRIDISLTGLENIPPETLLALSKMYMAGSAVRGGKGKGGKKQL
ncbi:hypothetical protein HY839_03095 [Candidatus Azambacteria bacterium]|nr:hypothetical protein [Candidatus Azambacteria bacterium]